LGLEDIKDNSGGVIQDAPLDLWANLKQRALDVALKEINKQSDIQLELEFVGGFLCLFTNIFAKSVARVSPSQ
jgi:hypothetical protein